MFQINQREGGRDQVVDLNISIDPDGDVWVSSGQDCDIFEDPKDAIKHIKKQLKRSLKVAQAVQKGKQSC